MYISKYIEFQACLFLNELYHVHFCVNCTITLYVSGYIAIPAYSFSINHLYFFQVCRWRGKSIRYRCLCSTLAILLIFQLPIWFLLPYTQQKTHYTFPNGTRTIAHATRFFNSQNPWKKEGFKGCEFDNCALVDSVESADAVLFHHYDMQYPFTWWHKRNRHQRWVYYGGEPQATVQWWPTLYDGIFNWTATFVDSSDIVQKYDRIRPLSHEEKLRANSSKDYAQGKSKMAVIVSSHCYFITSGRWDWVRDLEKYMDVDVFGRCSKRPCGDTCSTEMLQKQYKFYLSFENARCKDYITEKFWDRGLKSEMIPVVIGGLSKQDYMKVAPPHSFIYAHDFASPKELAMYLKHLDKNDNLYNEYFLWKKEFKVDNSRQGILCGLCRALHNKTMMSQPKVYNNWKEYWHYSHCINAGPGQGGIIDWLTSYIVYFFSISI